MEMNPCFQGKMDRFFHDVINGIDKEAKVTEQAMTAYAANIKKKQEELYKLFNEAPALSGLVDQREQMLKTLDVDGLDAYNGVVGKINAILETYNAVKHDTDKLDLLPEINPESLQRMREANAELTRLSDALITQFENMRRRREAEAAEKNLYADQIRELREAWQADQTGAAFVQTLNGMQAANRRVINAFSLFVFSITPSPPYSAFSVKTPSASAAPCNPATRL